MSITIDLPVYQEARAVMDGIGIAFLTLTVAGTLAVLFAFYLIWQNRHLVPIQKLNLTLLALTVIVLHSYWTISMLSYVLPGFTSCKLEFQMVSWLLVLGVSLFQVHNLHILALSLDYPPAIFSHAPRGLRLLFRPVQHMPFGTRLAAVALLFSLLFWQTFTFIAYFTSRKFQKHGTWSDYTNEFECRRGMEWFPAIIWLCFNVVVVIPSLLAAYWKTPNKYYWRAQTLSAHAAIVYGLALWISQVVAAAPEGTELNNFWGTHLWFLPCISVLEAAILYGPIRIINDSRRISEVPNSFSNVRPIRPILVSSSFALGIQAPSSYPLGIPVSSSFSLSMPVSLSDFDNMRGEERAGFLCWALQRDFSGENLLFLHYVNLWKAYRAQLSHQPSHETLRHNVFNLAIGIYEIYITRTANYPVNIGAGTLTRLEDVFSTLTEQPPPTEPTANVAPFGPPSGPPSETTYVEDSDSDDHNTVVPDYDSWSSEFEAQSSGSSEINIHRYVAAVFEDVERLIGYSRDIPEGFDFDLTFPQDLFDDAGSSVAALVGRDTYPKFIRFLRHGSPFRTLSVPIVE